MSVKFSQLLQRSLASINSIMTVSLIFIMILAGEYRQSQKCQSLQQQLKKTYLREIGFSQVSVLSNISKRVMDWSSPLSISEIVVFSCIICTDFLIESRRAKSNPRGGGSSSRFLSPRCHLKQIQWGIGAILSIFIFRPLNTSKYWTKQNPLHAFPLLSFAQLLSKRSIPRDLRMLKWHCGKRGLMKQSAFANHAGT